MNLDGGLKYFGQSHGWARNMNKRKRVAQLKHRQKAKKLEEKRKALKPGK
jgi:hypothetical protein